MSPQILSGQTRGFYPNSVTSPLLNKTLLTKNLNIAASSPGRQTPQKHSPHLSSRHSTPSESFRTPLHRVPSGVGAAKWGQSPEMPVLTLGELSSPYQAGQSSDDSL
mmetsp:Transcript_48956/g.76379  ORF Transcript_48956/g.76379 Transcript_48956/m.76379 type:complete len:107 (-) Transcript_48956:706-1026(-)